MQANPDRATFYERMAGRADWDAATNPHETARRLSVVFEALLAEVRLRDMRLLDAGSGGGHFSAEAARLGARVVSLDLGRNLLRQTARRAATSRVLGSTLALPFDRASFDLVLSTEVIEHTPEPMAALGELCRVIRPGGRLALTTPSRLWLPAVLAATRLGVRPYEGYENFLWPRACRRSLEEHGLRVERIFGFNLVPLFHPWLEPLHDLGDRAGRAVPWLYVNFAVLGVKR